MSEVPADLKSSEDHRWARPLLDYHGRRLAGGWAPGADPQRRDYASAAGFADPDGNTWVIQEIGHAHAEREHRR